MPIVQIMKTIKVWSGPSTSHCAHFMACSNILAHLVGLAQIPHKHLATHNGLHTTCPIIQNSKEFVIFVYTNHQLINVESFTRCKFFKMAKYQPCNIKGHFKCNFKFRPLSQSMHNLNKDFK